MTLYVRTCLFHHKSFSMLTQSTDYIFLVYWIGLIKVYYLLGKQFKLVFQQSDLYFFAEFPLTYAMLQAATF